MFRRKDAKPDDSIADRFDAAIRYLAAGDGDSAITILHDCIASAPEEPALYFILGEALKTKGDRNAATGAYKQYLARDAGDTMGAGSRLFALDRKASSHVIPRSYIERLFDNYAHRFDHALVAELEYKAPEAIAEAIRAAHPQPFARILDLGCGTGLCSAPFAGQGAIDGVDLSANMLEKAREKAIFSGLHQSGIAEFLETTKDKYDLVICADVLAYLGVPDETLAQVSNILVPNGLFAFTVQQVTETDIILGSDRRFWHSRAYVERALAQTDLKIENVVETVLRLEAGEPVPGLIFIAKK